MDGIINVAPESLRRTAGDFTTKAGTIQGITSQMLTLIRELNAIWGGDASKAYIDKFNGLEDDMTLIFKMIQEHGADLESMATLYENAEKDNISATQGLNNNIIS